MTAPPESGIPIILNGTRRTLDVAEETPLLLALRNHAGLVSVRYGCGLGLCGACTVLIDGAPGQACVVRTGDVESAEVTTLEGLGTEEDIHPIQQAFLDLQAAQCGYCIPGTIMRTAALPQRDPNPSRQDFRDALDGHLCRCGTHVRILDAVARAATLRREVTE